MATVPHGVRSGEQFPVLVNNQQLMVTCPPGVRPGMQVRIMVPTSRRGANQGTMSSVQGGGSPSRGASPSSQSNDAVRSPFGNQMFEVNVPQGVRPGQAFALIANGQRVMVTCPANARPGQKIRFQLPIKLSSDEIQSIKLNYQKDGWIRCLSTDLTFHWVRSEGEVDSEQEAKKKLEWAFEQTAFVRELRTLTVGTSTSKATHSLQLVPAKDAALSTVVPAINNGTSLAQELSRYAAMPFQHKEAWFRQQIAKLQVPWEDGHIKINVRRENLLEDSMEATESITQADMRKIFRFEFIAEPG